MANRELQKPKENSSKNLKLIQCIVGKNENHMLINENPPMKKDGDLTIKSDVQIEIFDNSSIEK